jgi:hypothetical protein
MKAIKKIGHWILFLIGGYLGTWIVLAIVTLLPIFVGLLLFEFGDFWFFLLGSIALSFYYLLVYYGFEIFFTFLNKKKPDYWISNIFLGLVTFYFFYTLITSLGKNITESKELFMNFKGIALLIAILPAYLQILFYAIVAPFTKEGWNLT